MLQYGHNNGRERTKNGALEVTDRLNVLPLKLESEEVKFEFLKKSEVEEVDVALFSHPGVVCTCVPSAFFLGDRTATMTGEQALWIMEQV